MGVYINLLPVPNKSLFFPRSLADSKSKSESRRERKKRKRDKDLIKELKKRIKRQAVMAFVPKLSRNGKYLDVNVSLGLDIRGLKRRKRPRISMMQMAANPKV